MRQDLINCFSEDVHILGTFHWTDERDGDQWVATVVSVNFRMTGNHDIGYVDDLRDEINSRIGRDFEIDYAVDIYQQYKEQYL